MATQCNTLDGGCERVVLVGQDAYAKLIAADSLADSIDDGNEFDTAQRDNSSTIKDSLQNVESFI